MGVTIPLPELDVTKPAPAPPPDALAEFQRAASLQTEAARQQAIQAQTTAQEQSNQAQALALKDETMRRDLAPQFVQKDSTGKPTGFDTEGLYSAMLEKGADPASITTMRMKQIEMQKSMIGLSDAQLAHQDKVNDEIANSLNSVRDIQDKSAPKPSSTPLAPSASAVSGAENPLGPPAAGTAGITPAATGPSLMDMANHPIEAALATPPANTGKAPAGTPESLARPQPGSVPTSTEAALQDSAANAPRPITPEAQTAYQKELIRLHSLGIPIGNFKPVLTDERDLDQAAAELGLHKQQMAEAEQLAKTQESAGKGAQAQAEADAALWKQAGEGTLVNVRTGQLIHGVASPDMEAFRAYVSHGGDPLQYPAYKAAQVANATLNTDVQKAVATEIAKQKALSPDLSQILNVTRAGHPYINRDDIPQGSAGVTEQQALAQGIPVVSKDTAGTLEDIDTAKANQDYMLNQIGKKLASDPTGRLYKAPENTIEQLAQTDPTLAAMGTYRNAAIQSMRAVAGSKGLRINQYEVQMAIDNDIPKMTDTLPVAQQKLQNLKAFLDNTENSHLVRNRAAAAKAPGNDFFSQFGGQARTQ